MKYQYTTQEKLWDLRRDHGYTLEQVAEAVQISKATLSKYENKENKEYNNVTLNKLAQYYNVSLDWLTCNTEVRELSDTPIQDLRLDDETIEFLKTGHFNPRLLCEILKHPNFVHLINEIEIYVDGHATQKFKNINDCTDAIRIKIFQQNSIEEMKYCTNIFSHMRTNEDEFFFHNIHGELDTIMKDIRVSHEKDRESAPIEREVTNLDRANELAELGFEGNPTDAMLLELCDTLCIPPEQVTDEDYMALQNFFNKSIIFGNVKQRKLNTIQ